MWLELDHSHSYSFGSQTYQIKEELHLVNVPSDMLQAITLPDFSGLKQLKAWKWIMMFALIGTLESMLRAKAIDSIDPWSARQI